MLTGRNFILLKSNMLVSKCTWFTHWVNTSWWETGKHFSVVMSATHGSNHALNRYPRDKDRTQFVNGSQGICAACRSRVSENSFRNKGQISIHLIGGEIQTGNVRCSSHIEQRKRFSANTYQWLPFCTQFFFTFPTYICDYI